MLLYQDVKFKLIATKEHISILHVLHMLLFTKLVGCVLYYVIKSLNA